MATPDALNGTNVFVAMQPTPVVTVYTQIGGQNSHTLTLNNGIIDITNKSSAQFRELLAGQGTQSLDLSMELTFNSQVTFRQMRTAWKDKTLQGFQIDIDGTIAIIFEGMIATFNQTSPDGDKLTAAVTIQSSGSFDISATPV